MSEARPDVLASGHGIVLQAVDERSVGDLVALDGLRERVPQMGGAMAAGRGGPAFAPPMLARNAAGEVIGLMEDHRLPGYEGVASVTIFIDRDRVPAGQGMFVYGLYVEWLFTQGVRLVHHEVLEFNRLALGLLRRGIAPETAVMPEHAYVAGRWWDVHVFAFDAKTFAASRGGTLMRWRGPGHAG